MPSVEVCRHQQFHDALAAPERSPEIAAADDVYGWLVGSWKLDVRHYWGIDVSDEGIVGEVHAGWTLEGRAVQDIWIMPRRGQRTPRSEKHRNMYGTTLRVWDPIIEAWRITLTKPAGDHHEQQIGRQVGSDIVQMGTRPDGTTTRWTFTEMTHDSFHWRGESLDVDGTTWKLEGEFFATRTA